MNLQWPEPASSRHCQRRFAMIQQRGDPANEFWYVESGSVQVGRYGIGGRLLLLALLGPGDTFGELAFMGEFPRTVDSIAGSDCTLIRIGNTELQSLMMSDPAITRLLLKTMALTVQDALLQLRGDQQEGATIRATQQDLADLVGVSRVSLGKALTKLQAAGLIEPGYGAVTIPDGAALEKFVAV